MKKESGKRFGLLLLTAILFTACGGSSTPSAGGTESGTSLQVEGTVITNQSGSTDKSDGTLQEKENANVSSFKTRAPAEDVTATENTLIVAEGDKGVEIIRIGYNDRIDHEVIATITGINATFVTLSDDARKLYVQNREGYINVYDISDVRNPLKAGLYTKEAIRLEPATRNGRYEFVVRNDKGMYIYDTGTSGSKKLVTSYTRTPVYGIVLVDGDTKALTATKNGGVDLLDISNFSHIEKIGNHPLAGETLGLSFNAKSGLLFVANGDQGVKVFNLNIFIDEMLTN